MATITTFTRARPADSTQAVASQDLAPSALGRLGSIIVTEDPAQDGGAIGLVPEENLVGRAWVSVFSTDGSANWFLPWTWVTAARWSRIGEGF